MIGLSPGTVGYFILFQAVYGSAAGAVIALLLWYVRRRRASLGSDRGEAW